MKIIKLLAFVLAVSFATVSCSDDPSDNAASVSGNKYETSYVKMDMTGDLTLSVEYSTKEELIENGMYFDVEFKADGKVYSEGEESGTWTQSGSTVTVTDEEEILNLTISGDVLRTSTTETEGDNSVTIVMEFTKM